MAPAPWIQAVGHEIAQVLVAGHLGEGLRQDAKGRPIYKSRQHEKQELDRLGLMNEPDVFTRKEWAEVDAYDKKKKERGYKRQPPKKKRRSNKKR